MDVWADVRVDALNERLALQARALFFIPVALERCNEAGLTVAALAAFSKTAPHGTPRPLAGRSAISKVLRCLPVVYDSAIGFINAANLVLVQRGVKPLSETDIVACIFRLKDPIDVMKALDVGIEEVVSGTGLSTAIVNAAFARYRLQYRDASRIWEFAKSMKSRLNDGQNRPALELITDDPRTFIKTDDRSPIAVKNNGIDVEEYVYTWSNLIIAPKIGHPWAIENNNSSLSP